MASMLTFHGDFGGGASRLKRFQWTAAAVEGADAVGPRLAEAIRKAAPVAPVNGGRLRDATRYQRRTAPGKVRLEFRAEGVPYVPFVLHATAPHEIVPRAALALHWTTPSGASVFARKVNHPGTRGNNYPLRAATAMRGDIRDAFEAAIRKTLGGAP